MGKDRKTDALELEVEDRRTEYLEAITRATGADALTKWRQEASNATLPLTVIAEQWLAVQRAKLAYEDALGRLQAARDSEAQDRADQALVRSEAMQKSMTCATWMIALFTIVLAAATVFDQCNKTIEHAASRQDAGQNLQPQPSGTSQNRDD